MHGSVPSPKSQSYRTIGDPVTDGVDPLPSKLTVAFVAAGFDEIVNDAAARADGVKRSAASVASAAAAAISPAARTPRRPSHVRRQILTIPLSVGSRCP